MPRRRRRSPSKARTAPSGPTATDRASWALQWPLLAAEGWFMDGQGYIARMVRVNGKRRYERRHRFIMEQILGRKLLSTETVHHKNGCRHDNENWDNLELWTTHQPSGQRPQDLLAYAAEIIARYGTPTRSGDLPLPSHSEVQ